VPLIVLMVIEAEYWNTSR